MKSVILSLSLSISIFISIHLSMFIYHSISVSLPSSIYLSLTHSIYISLSIFIFIYLFQNGGSEVVDKTVYKMTNWTPTWTDLWVAKFSLFLSPVLWSLSLKYYVCIDVFISSCSGGGCSSYSCCCSISNCYLN